MKRIKTTHTVIIGAGFSGLYLAHHLIASGKNDFLAVAPRMKTVSDKSYFNIRSRGVRQTSLRESMRLASYGKSNKQLVSQFINKRVKNNMFEIARDTGCKVMYQDLVMRHPFYSKGVCIPSDNLYSFDFVDEENKRLELTHHLVRAHNAHHKFDDICKEYQKSAKRYAVNGKQRIELDIEPHFVLGGIQINKRGETNVKNMYALGECAYGMHGKGRLGGGSIGEILVMSRVVAKQIVE